MDFPLAPVYQGLVSLVAGTPHTVHTVHCTGLSELSPTAQFKNGMSHLSSLPNLPCASAYSGCSDTYVVAIQDCRSTSLSLVMSMAHIGGG